MNIIQLNAEQFAQARDEGSILDLWDSHFTRIGDEFVQVVLVTHVDDAPKDDFREFITERARKRANGELASPLNSRQRKLLGRTLREFAGETPALNEYRSGTAWTQVCADMRTRLNKGEPEASAAHNTVRALKKLA